MRLMASEIATLTGLSEAEAERRLLAGEFGAPELVNGQLGAEHGVVARRLKREFSGDQIYEAIRGRGMPA